MFPRRIASRIGVGLGAIALASAPLAASAATATHLPAHTPASCSNQGCNGKDPAATGCSTTFQARTIRTAPIMSHGKQVGWVELRWSPFCGNNWARVISTTGPATLAATATRADHAKTSATGKGTALWTPMIFGRDLCVSATGTINGATATTTCG
ncbi:hypothetical protein Caci_5251 [Catenulispora acidiphila DSM 44928]|uniref:DUF2690 domain-containing protein n=1 Tax=Catenulispora acidiphila (strain DSM 44928 / JCM 14897 / NBRC 102108 / NRRL B-24433 / ID139908) TaxID=479433 RepID=C7Q6S5_CATAD|nr:DUF2690 domain-containing protein [Catenulispora acidiphila]ACU74110.1 hypothetical protein Caci_5251 [Catenulispora acidiphila DSM 44928]